PKGLVEAGLGGLDRARTDPQQLVGLPRATGYTPREIRPGEAMPDDPPVRVAGAGPHPLVDAAVACFGDVHAPPAKPPEPVPPNSVSLAVTNRRFVEAYLVGLNHELGRELLWNGYPTDQRGTTFARFWDPSGTLGTPPDDIEPIAGWTGVLGVNAAGAQADED